MTGPARSRCRASTGGALHILPACLLLVTAAARYPIIVRGREELTALLPDYYLFLANFLREDIPLLSIAWSLSVEEQYYLLWPLLLALLPARFPTRAAVLGGLAAICLGAMRGPGAMPAFATQHAVFALPGMSCLAILTGALLAVLLHDPRGYRLLWRLCGGRRAAPGLFALLIVHLRFSPADLAGAGDGCADGAVPRGAVMREDHALRPLMRWPPVARIGEISYGLYLYHLIGLHLAHLLAERLGLDPAVRVRVVGALYPLISVALAEVSHRWYERPFLARKQARSRRAPSAGAGRGLVRQAIRARAWRRP